MRWALITVTNKSVSPNLFPNFWKSLGSSWGLWFWHRPIPITPIPIGPCSALVAHDVFRCFNVFRTESAYIASYSAHIFEVLPQRALTGNKTVMMPRSRLWRFSCDLAILAEKVIKFVDCHSFGILDLCGTFLIDLSHCWKWVFIWLLVLELHTFYPSLVDLTSTHNLE